LFCKFDPSATVGEIRYLVGARSNEPLALTGHDVADASGDIVYGISDGAWNDWVGLDGQGDRLIGEFLEAIAKFKVFLVFLENRQQAEGSLEEGCFTVEDGPVDHVRSLDCQGSDGIPLALAFDAQVDFIFWQAVRAHFVETGCRSGAFCRSFGCFGFRFFRGFTKTAMLFCHGIAFDRYVYESLQGSLELV
jgi:hypothetical protein